MLLVSHFTKALTCLLHLMHSLTTPGVWLDLLLGVPTIACLILIRLDLSIGENGYFLIAWKLDDKEFSGIFIPILFSQYVVEVMFSVEG